MRQIQRAKYTCFYDDCFGGGLGIPFEIKIERWPGTHAKFVSLAKMLGRLAYFPRFRGGVLANLRS